MFHFYFRSFVYRCISDIQKPMIQTELFESWVLRSSKHMRIVNSIYNKVVSDREINSYPTTQ